MQAVLNAFSNARTQFGKHREAQRVIAAMQQNKLAQKFALDQQEAYRQQLRQLEAEYALLQNRLMSI